MYRSQIASSLLSVLIILSFSGCKTWRITNAISMDIPANGVQNTYFVSTSDHVYKAQLDIYNHPLSGILYLKKTNDSTHRFAFTTDFGNKLMDFEITPHTFHVHYILPDMDRKTIKKVLEKDFRLLVQQHFIIEEAWEQKKEHIYKSSNGKEQIYLYFQKNNDRLSQILVRNKRKEKVKYIFSSDNEISATHIQILHNDIKLSIALTSISE